MDRSTFRSMARLKLNEPTTGGFWTDTNYNDALHEAGDDFAVRTKCVKAHATFTTTVDTRVYDFSESSIASFISVAEIHYYTDTTNYDVLIPVTRDELSFYQSQNVGYTGTPTYYCYEDRQIEFDCATDASMTVHVYFYKLPDNLTADDQVIEIPIKFQPALVYYVCWKFAEADGLDPNKVMYFKNEYMEWVLRTQKELQASTSSYGAIKDDTTLGYYG